MKKIKFFSLLIIFTTLVINSCVEPIEIESITFEDALVVEATITNEFKHQEINLSRTFMLEEDGPLPESNADVRVIDGSQNVFLFQETEPGKYVSTTQFNAVPNNEYQLMIVTNNGREYQSQTVTLTANTSEIEEVKAIQDSNETEGLDGVSIQVTSFDPTGNSRLYRYEYEETYQIIAPNWSARDAIIISETPPEVDVAPRSQEERVCYNTIKSNTIIQTETTDLSEDRVSNRLIRFIPSDDFIIRSRYSILVKQFVQSLESFTFYRVLNELSSSESLFSQIQPGFLAGNMISVTDPSENVVGFFDVSSVSEERIFFNYRDVFPDPFQPLPDYITSCEVDAPLLDGGLINTIRTRRLTFVDTNDVPGDIIAPGGPFVMVTAACGDCTMLGSNIEPDFWID
ncbi:DUF4249 family protein [Flavobacteriaceae bacterium AU392]|nr:DUF4249 domain-containing protein [Flavobacteriaceae bacterium]RKM85459.1 DUF4249 family protein [Flavobacteriaceae bacterium AU392]